MTNLDDNEPRPRRTAHPGENLADLSVEELKDRTALYRMEIERLEREIAAKEKHMQAADSLFRR
jgi:uncharacterized small protein (DUF1192 family)